MGGMCCKRFQYRLDQVRPDYGNSQYGKPVDLIDSTTKSPTLKKSDIFEAYELLSLRFV
jgi:hypothetical protein